MNSSYLIKQLPATFLFLLVSLNLFPQEKEPGKDYQPKVGQEGKDVIWVPTYNELVEKMLNLAKLTPEDYLIDLGSGDGRTVITAAKRGARALGVEYNHDLIEFSRQCAIKEGVNDKALFIEADLFGIDLSEATVITLFLLPEINMKLRPRLLDLKPGTRIVSNTFTMKEWQFDDTTKIYVKDNRFSTAYLWIVPSKVEGRWKIDQENELVLTQKFQIITGELRKGNKTLKLTEGKLRGNEIFFIAGSDIYTGEVDGNRITGTVITEGNKYSWNATRIE